MRYKKIEELTGCLVLYDTEFSNPKEGYIDRFSPSEKYVFIKVKMPYEENSWVKISAIKHIEEL